MSKKGCSPDNSACEAFFGRLKNEVFYGEDWSGWSIEEFMSEIDAYIRWYNERRIKLTLDGMSAAEYGESPGLMAALGVRENVSAPVDCRYQDLLIDGANRVYQPCKARNSPNQADRRFDLKVHI